MTTLAPAMVAAHPVVAGRCPHCGHAEPIWTAGRILEAFREFHAEHGRAPFRREWNEAAPHHPSYETVRAMFGFWSTAIQAAGLTMAPRSNTVRHWTRDEVIAAIFNWRYDVGELPRANDWKVQASWHPSYDQVRRLFGSWNAAIEAAGYEPRLPNTFPSRNMTAGTGSTLDGMSAGARRGGNHA